MTTAMASPYALVVFWRARPGLAADIEATLLELAHEVRQEPGALGFTVHRDLADDHLFVLYECYRDEQAFLTHRQTPHFQRLVLEHAVPRLERRDIHPCVPLT